MDSPTPTRARGHGNKWLTLLAASVATFMLLLDITIVNVALPDISGSLDANFSDLQWVIDAYALTLAALLLTAGSLADRYGRKRVFTTGLVLFTLASIACGVSVSPLQLILSRAVQGIGGAAMFATSLALIASAFEGRERGTAFGIWGAVTGLAVAVGPLVGGALVAGLSWEWIFFVNIPIGLFAIAVTLRYVAESRDPRERRLDVAGVALFTAALVCGVLGLIEGGRVGFGTSWILALLGGSIVLLALFAAVEARVKDPMLPLSLFRIPTFVGASIGAFALSASMFALFLNVALYMQNTLGYSALESGLRFLPITLVTLFVAPVAGRLSERVPVRFLLSGGLLLVATGLLLMSRVSPGDDWTVLLPGFLVAGIGIGLFNPPLASTAVSVVAPQDAGTGSGVNTTFRQVGIATGVAALGALSQARIDDKLRGAGVDPNLPLPGGSSLGEVVANGTPVLPGLPPGAGESAYVAAFSEILQVGSAVALLGAVACLVLIRRRDLWALRHPRPAAEPGPEATDPSAPARPAPGAGQEPVPAG